MIKKKLIMMILLSVAVVVCIVQLPSAFAQDAASDDLVKAGMSLSDMIQYGGWLMYVLAAMSILTGAFILYFFAVLTVRQVAPPQLHLEVIKRISDGNLDEARNVCELHACALSSVILAGLDYIKSMTHVDKIMLKDIIESEGVRQADSITGQTQYLHDMGAIAPMVGLLGTVLGMLQTFSVVALDIARAKPITLAAGVSQALVTTAFGLMVGIPAMIFYAYFRRRASKLVSYLESASTDVMTALSSGE